MNFLKKFTALFVLSFFAVSIIFCSPVYAENPDKDIFIIYTNDVHCGIDDFIGYSGLAYYRNQMKNLTPYVTLVDNGDAVQGASIGTISHGRYIIEIMNALSYDLAIPGNHEFDYSWGQFEILAKNLNCGYISCNIHDLRNGNLIFKPYKIISYGKTKVAFIGVTTPDSITTSTPSYFRDENGNFIYDFDGDETGKKLYDSIQKAVDEAKKENVDFVILISHLGLNNVEEVWSSSAVAANTRGIDVILDGHSHEIIPGMQVKNLDSKDVIISQAGTKLKYIGELKIDTEGKLSTRLIDSVGGKDEKVEKVIAQIKGRFEDTLKTKLSYISFDLLAMDNNGSWLVRSGETNICNLVTDAMFDAASRTKTGKADIAFCNAGALRTNIKAGEITFNNALSVLPFGNTVCMIEVSGQSILDELEIGARRLPENNGGFLHVSGMTYTINQNIPSPVDFDEKHQLKEISGERRVSDVKINGEPLDPEKIYKVISTSYVLFAGGDGHMFKGAKMIEPDFEVDSDMLAHFLKKFPVIPEKYRTPENRIKFLK